MPDPILQRIWPTFELGNGTKAALADAAPRGKQNAAIPLRDKIPSGHHVFCFRVEPHVHVVRATQPRVLREQRSIDSSEGYKNARIPFLVVSNRLVDGAP